MTTKKFSRLITKHKEEVDRIWLKVKASFSCKDPVDIYSHNLFSCLCIDIVKKNRCWSFSGFKEFNILKTSALNLGAPNQNIVQNQLNIELLNVYVYGTYMDKN